jgi:hypothetical protein
MIGDLVCTGSIRSVGECKYQARFRTEALGSHTVSSAAKKPKLLRLLSTTFRLILQGLACFTEDTAVPCLPL